MLSRLIYHSRVVGLCSADMLNDILASSERNNARDEVTGALLFNPEWFVQILEGRREILSKTLFRLFPDPRHAEVAIADVRPIEERMFSNWWMGAAAIEGLDARFLSAQGIDEQFDPRRLNGEAMLMMALAVSDTLTSRIEDEA